MRGSRWLGASCCFWRPSRLGQRSRPGRFPRHHLASQRKFGLQTSMALETHGECRSGLVVALLCGSYSQRYVDHRGWRCAHLGTLVSRRAAWMVRILHVACRTPSSDTCRASTLGSADRLVSRSSAGEELLADQWLYSSKGLCARLLCAAIVPLLTKACVFVLSGAIVGTVRQDGSVAL